MPQTLSKGQNRPLHVTQQANHRIYVGLSWDPSADKSFTARLKNIIKHKALEHDLDLACYLYDQEQNCIDVISGKAGSIIDASECIYHSGDDTEGVGEGDDEQISAELKNLPKNIHAIIFKATIESGHSFKEIESPALRLVDAYSKRTLLNTPLNEAPESHKANNYIFIALRRENASPTGWQTHLIDEYTNAPNNEDWKNTLKPYLSAISD